MFITLEGPEGSGKTTLMIPLAAHLRREGYDVLTTREPGGTPIGSQIRATLLDLRTQGMSPRTEALLFLAARAQLVDEVIRPHLERGGVVISDRYGDSTLAYQGYAQGGDLAVLRQMLAYATGGLTPDLTILLDLDVREGIRRRQEGAGEWNRLDAAPEAYHERVRGGYLRMAQAEPARWVVIDAGRPASQVQADLCAVVTGRLKLQAQS